MVYGECGGCLGREEENCRQSPQLRGLATRYRVEPFVTFGQLGLLAQSTLAVISLPGKTFPGVEVADKFGAFYAVPAYAEKVSGNQGALFAVERHHEVTRSEIPSKPSRIVFESPW